MGIIISTFFLSLSFTSKIPVTFFFFCMKSNLEGKGMSRCGKAHRSVIRLPPAKFLFQLVKRTADEVPNPPKLVESFFFFLWLTFPVLWFIKIGDDGSGGALLILLVVFCSAL